MTCQGKIRPAEKKFDDDKLEALLDEDPCQTQQKLENSLGVNRPTFSNQLKALRFKCITRAQSRPQQHIYFSRRLYNYMIQLKILWFYYSIMKLNY